VPPTTSLTLVARAAIVTAVLATAAAALTGCPTRNPDIDASYDGPIVLMCDPRIPDLGAGQDVPTCSADGVIDVNETTAVRDGNDLHLRVDTRNRRNELHPSCVDRDSTEVVLRYTAPPESAHVQALRITSAACGTQFDTVLSVRNDCGPEYNDYSCNNDGFTDDGRDTRKSTVYYTNLEPEQFVYILVDGFDGSAGQAELVITEYTNVGVAFAPCIPIPPDMATVPGIETASFRCTDQGTRCRPGAAPDGTDLCLPLLPLGAACDPDERRNVCESSERNVVCAQNPISRTEAVCALPGTAPGAYCRRDEPRCDARLACSPGAGFGARDICVPLRGSGASCDPAMVGFVDRCDMGLACCGDMPDAGATFTCRPGGWSPCFQFVAGP
jgi:hypothetical protein